MQSSVRFNLGITLNIMTFHKGKNSSILLEFASLNQYHLHSKLIIRWVSWGGILPQLQRNIKEFEADSLFKGQ